MPLESQPTLLEYSCELKLKLSIFVISSVIFVLSNTIRINLLIIRTSKSDLSEFAEIKVIP